MYNILDYIESDVDDISRNVEMIKKETSEINKSIGWLENDLNELHNISETLDFIKIELAIIIIILIFIFIFNNKDYFIAIRNNFRNKNK